MIVSLSFSPTFRKANEGLAAISDEEASPISVRQMAYGKRCYFQTYTSVCLEINKTRPT